MSNSRPPFEVIAAWTSLGLGVLAVLLYGAWPVLFPSSASSSQVSPTRIVIDADTAASLRRIAGLIGAEGRMDSLTQDATRLDRAESLLEGLGQHHPKLAEIHRLRGLLAMARGENTRARDAFLRCLELDPPNLPAHLALGATYANLEQVEEAVKTFRRASEYHPDSTAALDNLGQALWLLGEEDEALEVYRRKLKIQGDDVATEADQPGTPK